MLAAARERDAGARIEPSLDRVGILHRADDKVATYSMGMRQRLGVAACLLGDPELLILDEPMNGLDPAGMQDMREMVGALVAEGRTVVLSSHLLDEVERTCDTVAIVDRGRVVRQGPLTELLTETSFVLEVGCADPQRARAIVASTRIGERTATQIAAESNGLRITLPAGTGNDVIAEINRALVDSGVPVHRLDAHQASLEAWFLQVTSRLGEPE
jgi:ABC-2 type transport system ATP-binding protein